MQQLHEKIWREEWFKFNYSNQTFWQVTNLLVQPKNEVCIVSVMVFSMGLQTYTSNDSGALDIAGLLLARCKTYAL
jgi:hypothetical protein